jgi:ribosome-binding factor A
VETSPDLRAAKVHVSVLGSAEEKEATMAGLASSHGVLQAKIAAETRMKRTPTLRFHYDETVEQGMRITELLEGEE